MIDAVSEMYRCDWDKACSLNVMEFLNVYAYVVEKKRRELKIQKEANEKLKAKMKRHR